MPRDCCKQSGCELPCCDTCNSCCNPCQQCNACNNCPCPCPCQPEPCCCTVSPPCPCPPCCNPCWNPCCEENIAKDYIACCTRPIFCSEFGVMAEKLEKMEYDMVVIKSILDDYIIDHSKGQLSSKNHQALRSITEPKSCKPCTPKECLTSLYMISDEVVKKPCCPEVCNKQSCCKY